MDLTNIFQPKRPPTLEEARAMFPELKTLDITLFSEQGQELHDAIVDAVKDSQRIVVQRLYDELLMTQEQFKDLQKLMGTMEEYMEGFFIYKTSENVMEVRVKEKE